MKSTNKLFAATILAAATSFSATANASVFIKDYADEGLWNAYDAENQTYAARFRSDQGKDGFWLVVTDGQNPKGDGTSHAILYGDIENNRITAYTYNGENSSNSFNNGTLIGTYENAFTTGEIHPTFGYELTTFSLDVSEINNAFGEDFDGVQLGEQNGIWFHQSAGSEFTYGEDGSIVDYVFEDQTYLDRGNDVTFHRDSAERDRICRNQPNHYICRTATQLVSAGNIGAATPGSEASGGAASGAGSVPAPGGLALILVGLAGLGRKFLKKA